jgi:hypothetical protein
MTAFRDGAPAADRGRAAFLDEVCATLWPEPPGDTLRTRMLLLPGRRRPRLLVPCERRAAAAAVRLYGEPRSRRAVLATHALSLVLRSGVGGAIFRDRVELPASDQVSSIETYLRAEVDPELCISMYVGAPRANRKPVFQLLTRSGEQIGIAKVAMSPLARRLVDAEYETLVMLDRADLHSVRAPQVLHYGSWRGMPVLVQRPLPIHDRRVALTPSRLRAAMWDVAMVGYPEPTWSDVVDEVGSIETRLGGAPDSVARTELFALLNALAGRFGEIRLRVGRWHGDWTPWNMASTRNGMLLWDWERSAAGIPVGFDAMHHWLQSRVVQRRGEPRRVARECLVEAPGILTGFVDDPAGARVTALLYMAQLAARSLADGQARSGARLGDPGWWLLPAIREHVVTG